MRSTSITLILTVASVAGPIQARQASQPNEIIDEWAMTPGQAYVPIFIQKPLSGVVHERLCDLLRLSDAQSSMFMALAWAANASDQAIRREVMASVRSESAHLGALGAGVLSDIESAERYARFMDQVEKLDERIAAAHAMTLSGIEPALSDIQKGALKRARCVLERCRWNAVPKMRFSARADLSDLLRAMNAERSVFPSDPEAFDSMLADYEFALTQLLRRHAEALFAASKQCPVLLAQAATSDAATSMRLHASSERLQHAIDVAEERIARLTQSYLGLLTDFLSVEDAARLQRSYLLVAYPEAWPNPFDLNPIFDIAVHFVPQERRDEFDSIRDTWQARTLQTTDRMTRRVDRWLDVVTAGDGRKPDDYADFRKQMDEFQAMRASMSIEALTQLRSVLPEPQPRELAAETTEYHRRLESRRAQAEGLSYIP